jgi:hypothetical protein
MTGSTQLPKTRISKALANRTLQQTKARRAPLEGQREVAGRGRWPLAAHIDVAVASGSPSVLHLTRNCLPSQLNARTLAARTR